MKATENRLGCDRAGALNSPVNRRIQVQCPMGSGDIVIGGIFSKDPAQVSFTERDQMVDAFSPDRADQSLRIAILPW